MKRIWSFGTAAVMFGLATSAQAGLLGGLGCGKGGCCEEDCCPEACKPTICKPACEQAYTYQRRVSGLQRPCCGDECCESECCTAGCGSGAGCTGGSCLSPKKGCNLFKSLFGKKKGCGHGPGLCPTDCCDEGCTEGGCGLFGNKKGKVGTPCEIATLIYDAQTACHGKDRARAVDDLGGYNLRCHPEILCALVYSLNDADERVRKEAADAIGDAIGDGRLCCTQEVVSALTCALGDCDRGVRHQAEEALEACGYDVVDCDGGCCETGCTNGGCVAAAPAQTAPVPVTNSAPPAPMTAAPKTMTKPPAPKPLPKADAPKAAPAPPAPGAVPAPAPAEDPEAYFPSRFRQQTNRGGLGGLFSMAR